LLKTEFPTNTKCQARIKIFANNCFIENDIVWFRIKRQYEPSRVVIFLQASLVQDIVTEAHRNLLVGHDGIYKSKECLLQWCNWPGMDADNANHIKTGHCCQMRQKDNHLLPALLSLLPQPTEPNQWVHVDLFGPLKTCESGKNVILCMIDAFTKYVKFVPLPNKEAATVAEAIFDKWFCHFGMPLDLVTDEGKEFCAKNQWKFVQKARHHTPNNFSASPPVQQSRGSG
jgi:hypothetical protein